MSKTLVCAIQIGSSRICAAAAWRDQNGKYDISAIEQEPSEGCVRRGCVVNPDLAAERIGALVQKLSNRIKAEALGIGAAYVGIGGISMHSQMHHPSIELVEGKTIDANVVAALRQKSLQLFIPGYDIFGVEAVGYTLDDVDCLDPIGRTGSMLVAHHQLVIGQKRLKIDLRSAVEQAGIRLVDVLATPLCVSKILTPEEKQKGCVLVDIGYSLTTVSVYQGGVLRHLATIPLGGNSVTRDIASEGLTMEEAEDNKRRMESLDIVCRCRYEEIVANVLHQIEISGCQDKLSAGCILTGGASLQKELITLFGERLGTSYVIVRAYDKIVCGISDRKPQLSGLTTMIQSCTANCAIELDKSDPELFDDSYFAETTETESKEEEKVQEKEPEPKEPEQEPEPEKEKDKTTGGGRGGMLGRFFRDLVSGIDDN